MLGIRHTFCYLALWANTQAWKTRPPARIFMRLTTPRNSPESCISRAG